MAIRINVKTSKKGNLRHQGQAEYAGHLSRSETFSTREDAVEFAREREAELKAIVAAELSNAQLAAATAAMAPLAPLTKADYLKERAADALELFKNEDKCSARDKRLINTVIAKVGDVTIEELDTFWVDEYTAQLRLQKTHIGTFYAYGTIRGHIGALQRAVRWRARSLRLSPHLVPFSLKKHFPKNWEVKRTRRLKKHEERALREHFEAEHAHSAAHWLLLIDLAVETGARLQELILAEEDEFDVTRRVWVLPEEHCKTGEARVVGLTTQAQETVRKLQAMLGKSDPRMFHPILNPHCASQSFRQTTRKLGIDDLRFHDLRHEGISRLVSNHRDVSIYEIMKMVGHKSMAMLDRYAQLRFDEVAARLN